MPADDASRLATSRAPLFEARGLTKRFPGVVALRDVSFALNVGQIHALCGENGAGKSTLIKLLAGIHPRGSYEGELRMDGHVVAFEGIADAEAAGIAVITQELALVDELSVAENIFLGREPTRGGRIDWLGMHRRAAALLAEFGLAIDPEVAGGSLGIGQRQLVEIARAMDKRSRVLVLDEPTAALTGQEVAILLEHLRRLRAGGTACVYISHKLDEVFAVADQITVLRDGASVLTRPRAGTSAAEVIRAMVGREITELYPERPSAAAASTGEPVLMVSGLTASAARGSAPQLRNVELAVNAGEVLGIGGLMGAGRTELLMHLFGAWGHRVSGEVRLRGAPYGNPSPRDSIARGMVLVSEDRRRHGLVLGQDIGFNLSLSHLEAVTGPAGRVDEVREHRENQRWFDALRVKAPGQRAGVAGLSGGNQQKVVLGKALMTNPAVVLLDEPTRGIDLGARREIYDLIQRLTREGKAVVLVSSELSELMGLSDRILMLAGGRVGGLFRRDAFRPEALLAAAMGRHDESRS